MAVVIINRVRRDFYTFAASIYVFAEGIIIEEVFRSSSFSGKILMQRLEIYFFLEFAVDIDTLNKISRTALAKSLMH